MTFNDYWKSDHALTDRFESEVLWKVAQQQVWSQTFEVMDRYLQILPADFIVEMERVRTEMGYSAVVTVSDI